MRGARWAALAAVVVMLTLSAALLHAEDKPKDLIVGKWEPVKAPEGVKMVIEFTKDGKIKFTAGKPGEKEFNAGGTYKFTDDNNIEAKLTVNGKESTKKIKVVKVTKDELVTHDEGDKDDEKFKRVK